MSCAQGARQRPTAVRQSKQSHNFGILGLKVMVGAIASQTIIALCKLLLKTYILLLYSP
ncbi:MAG: hypothetical protein ACK4QL_10570 [Pseudanabaenaceae cyanobacterium]